MTTHMDNLMPAPVIASHGTSTGDYIGALQLLIPLIEFANMITQLESIAAKWAVAMANLETQIQQNLAIQQQYLADKYAITNPDKVNGEDLSTRIQLYSSDLGVIQSELQSDVKTIDPTLTTAQNEPNALSTSLNEFIQEAGTVNQGQQALANDRIA